MSTNCPTDNEFYLKGYLEVPNLCNPGALPWPAGASQASAPAGSSAASAVVPEPGVMPRQGSLIPQQGLMTPTPMTPAPAVGLPAIRVPPSETVSPPQVGPGPAAPVPPPLDKSSTLRLKMPAAAQSRTSAKSSPAVRPADPRQPAGPATKVSYDGSNPDNRPGPQSPSDKRAANSPPEAGFIGPLGYDVVQ
jgi:hypothetical protein